MPGVRLLSSDYGIRSLSRRPGHRIPGNGAAVISASVSGVKQREGQKYVSPELYPGTEVITENIPEPGMGLTRVVLTSGGSLHLR